MTSFNGNTPGAAVPGASGAMPSEPDHHARSAQPSFGQPSSHCTRRAPVAFFNAQSISMSRCKGHKQATRLTALRHNRREIQAELGAYGPIDPTRSRLNTVLHGPGTAAEVEARALARFAAAGIAPRRKDHVQAIELLVSLPQDSHLDTEGYFRATLAWARTRFGDENILAADIHRDEAAPHCHILVLPLRGNTWAGSKLLGGIRELNEMRIDFIRKVAHRFGLRAPAKTPQGAAKLRMAEQVIQTLAHANDGVMHSAVWPQVQQQIQCAPLPFHEQLGLPPPEAPPQPCKTMAQIFTSTGKGLRKEPEAWTREAGRVGPAWSKLSRPLAEPPATASEPQSPSSVGFDLSNDYMAASFADTAPPDRDAAHGVFYGAFPIQDRSAAPPGDPPTMPTQTHPLDGARHAQ